MKCLYCAHNSDKVIDSRETAEGTAIRRRRECLNCGKRFTTYEYVEKVPFMVIKKDGRREAFSRQKVIAGLVKACQKRPVSMENIERIVSEVEAELQSKLEHEVETGYIGEKVIDKLSRLDDVAYVRFASVYRQFRDINEFMRELRGIFNKKIK